MTTWPDHIEEAFRCNARGWRGGPTPRLDSLPMIQAYQLGLFLVLALGLPSIGAFFTGAHLPPLAATCIYGTGIMAAAFLMSWAAEVAEVDISASLAIAIVALLTVLPEYAIEAVPGLGRRRVLRPRHRGNHRGNPAGVGQRQRGQPAAHRAGLVGGHPHLLAQAPGNPGPAGQDRSGNDLPSDWHPAQLRHLRPERNPRTAGSGTDRGLRGLPVDELQEAVGGAGNGGHHAVAGFAPQHPGEGPP